MFCSLMKKYAGDESATKMVKDRRTEIKEEEENRAKGGKAAPTEHDDADAGTVGIDCVSCMLAYRDAHVLFPTHSLQFPVACESNRGKMHVRLIFSACACVCVPMQTRLQRMGDQVCGHGNRTRV